MTQAFGYEAWGTELSLSRRFTPRNRAYTWFRMPGCLMEVSPHQY